MKRQIRLNVFETNSSSTHSICLTKNNILDQKRDELYLEPREYGWEIETYYETKDKADYIYSALLYLNRKEDLNTFISLLNKNQIEVNIEPIDENKPTPLPAYFELKTIKFPGFPTIFELSEDKSILVKYKNGNIHPSQFEIDITARRGTSSLLASEYDVYANGIENKLTWQKVEPASLNANISLQAGNTLYTNRATISEDWLYRRRIETT
jgi:hypothetical protein